MIQAAMPSLTCSWSKIKCFGFSSRNVFECEPFQAANSITSVSSAPDKKGLQG